LEKGETFLFSLNDNFNKITNRGIRKVFRIPPSLSKISGQIIWIDKLFPITNVDEKREISGVRKKDSRISTTKKLPLLKERFV
jgi:hypothetical protein